MTLSVKPGVEITRLHRDYVRALPVIVDVFHAFGYDATTTSGNDGDHMPGSLHYADPLRALDWRTWANSRGEQMSRELKETIAKELRRELGPDFDVVVESTHIHIELEE